MFIEITQKYKDKNGVYNVVYKPELLNKKSILGVHQNDIGVWIQVKTSTNTILNYLVVESYAIIKSKLGA